MSQRLYTRVAVVQLAYHPAIVLSGRSPLEDPLFSLGAEDALRIEDELPPQLVERFVALRERIRTTYLANLRRKLVAILQQCQTWGAKLVVLPEYSVPWQLLPDVVTAGGQMVVVAGTHTVERDARKSGIYQQLGVEPPPLLSAVCPVLYRGRALAMQPKLNPAKPEDGQMRSGNAWAPITLPDGLPGPMGTLVCLDFLYRESEAHQRLVLPHLNSCRFIAVPSLTPTHTIGEFSTKAWEEARRYGRPVLYCDTAGLTDKEGGGTSIFVDEGHPSDLRSFPERVGYLERGEEGVIVADVDLGYVRVGDSTRYDWQRPVRPFAAASLVYGFHPADAKYQAWLGDSAGLLSSRDDDDAVEQLSARVHVSETTLLDAAAIGGTTRERRLRQLVHGHKRLQTVEHFHERLREVCLPADVLPLAVLRGAMASAVSDVLFDWQRQVRGPRMVELCERLRKAGESAFKARAERTEAANQAIGQARETVIAAELKPPEAPPAPPPPVRAVMPAGVDPAQLGVRQAAGWTVRFAATADVIQQEHLHEEHLEEHLRAAAARSSESGEQKPPSRRRGKEGSPSPRRPVYAGPAFDIPRDLLLLARAEGFGPCAAVSFEKPNSMDPIIGRMGVVVAHDSGWELWFDGHDALWNDDRSLYAKALDELGLTPLTLVPVSPAERDQRTGALVTPFRTHIDSLRRHRDFQLREVGGRFVDLIVQAGEQTQSGLSALDDWLAGSEQTALVLGEFGSGKSTLLAEWCVRLTERLNGPLPILVNLATAPATHDGLDMLLAAFGGAHDSDAAISQRAALELLIRHRLLLPCFDGFDEMATRFGDPNPAGRLASLLRVAASGGRVVITSRDHYFSSQSDLMRTTAATLRETLGTSAGHRVLQVRPLTTPQVSELIGNTLGSEQQTQSALKRIASTYDLTDLVQRPLLLSMVIQSLDRIAAGARVAPADVYEAYVQKWLEQTREDDHSLPREEKVRFAEALAEQLWRSGQPSCSWEDLRESVRSRIGGIRLPEYVPDAAAFLDVQGGAFFVHEGDSRYRFAHKSFLEFFLARALVRTLPTHPEEALATRPLTAEVASFVGELLKREGDPREASTGWGLLVGRELLDRGRDTRSGERARVNALRLLIGLGRWSGDPAGWIPEGADLRGLRLWGMDLCRTSLRGVRLAGSDLSGSDLTEADLTGADLSQARLVGANLTQTRLDGVQAAQADLSLVAADRCSLQAASLQNANLTQSVWTHCVWTDARLDGAELTRTGIWPANDGMLPGYVTLLAIPATSLVLDTQYCFDVPFAVVWSPNGRWLAIGSKGGQISLWDAAAGFCWINWRGHREHLSAVSWSRDGRKLATGAGDGTAKLWDTRTGELLTTLAGHKASVLWVSWSPNGRTLATGSYDRTVRLWDVATAELLHTLTGHASWVYSVSWSPDGRTLATGSNDRGVRLWDAATGKVLHTLVGHKDSVRSVEWSPDGRVLATGGDDQVVRLWDPITGAQRHVLSGHESGITAVAWSPDGMMLATGSHDCTVKLWDAASFEPRHTLAGHDSWVLSVSWNPDGNTLATGGNDCRAIIWEVSTGEPLRILNGRKNRVQSVSWSPDGRTLAAGAMDQVVRLWDAKAGEPLRTLNGHKHWVFSTSWHPDGRRLATGSADHTVRLWDATTGELPGTLTVHKSIVRAVSWSPDGRTLASGDDDGIVILSGPDRRTLLRSLKGHAKLIFSVAWSPDGGRLATSSYERTARLWDAEAQEPLHALTGHESWIRSVSWSPDGNTLATGSYDCTVKLWDPQTGKPLHTLAGDCGLVESVSWSPDGKLLAAGDSDGMVTLWDASEGKPLRVLIAHNAWVQSVSWSPDGSKLATGADDGTVRLWAQEGLPLVTLWAEGETQIALLPVGYFRAWGNIDGALTLKLRSPATPNAAYQMPLAGLRPFFERPDCVAAALTSPPPSIEHRDAELLAAGFTGGTPWDGQRRIVPALQQSSGTAGLAASIRSLHNPFRPGPAQDGVQDLPGRKDVLAELDALIESRSPAILIGPRRSGKTSILRLLNRQLAGQRKTRLITLEGKQIKTGDDLAATLADALGLPAPPRRSKKNRREHVASQFAELRRQPLLLFDEVIHLKEGDATLFPWLRALGQDLASIVYAGSPYDWVQVVQHAASVAPGSSFGNDVTPISLGPMAEDDALRFLSKTSQGQIPENAARWVIADCGAWPFYLQVMGHALFEAARSGKRKPLIDRSAFRDLYEQRVLADRSAPFTGRWQELPAQVRSLLLLPEHHGQRPVYLQQPPALRSLLVDTGLCSPQGIWLVDRPFFDWIRINAPRLSAE
ncbi:MAG: pentapeptide repeat-containing protein [Myxococcales bacterium]|nr:pentapeptide repeat-containing protein [Myxococcales bacterium]